MKKILSLILVLAFVLCGVAALNVSADVIINDWTIKRGGGFYIKNSAYEFEWKADNSGKTYEWPAIHNGSFKEGTITATVSPKGGIAIFFGAEGMEGLFTDLDDPRRGFSNDAGDFSGHGDSTEGT